MLIDTDLVHDEVETALLKEIEIVRNCENQLEQLINKCINQVRCMLASNN